MARSAEGRVTIADVARDAGVSPATVSLVLNRKPSSGISKATSDAVIESAVRVGYLHPSENLFLSTGDHINIAVMVPDVINPAFTSFLSQLSGFCSQHRIGLLLCNSNHNQEQERAYLSMLMERDISGIMYVYTPLCLDTLEKAARKIPVVVVGDSVQMVGNANIATDNYLGARMLAEHLYDLGHRKIAYITQPINRTSVLRERRLLGLRDYFSEKGHGKDFFVYEITTILPPSTLTSVEATVGRLQCRQLLEEHPEVTAIVTLGDLVAFGVYEELKTAGKRIPEDYSVASFDDIEFDRYVTPPLTSVDPKLTLRSKLAFDYLIQLITEGVENYPDPLSVSYRSTLCVRASTGPARK